MILRMLLSGLALLAAAPATARDPLLAPPLNCDLSTTCFIPRYVDVDPSAGALDHRCGALTGDGHKGTDFAVPSLAAMHSGVPVFPAAPGTIRAVRDGMPDTGTDEGPSGLECGNGVVIGHGDGWETQYCHLKDGTLAVEVGQRVGNTTMLGEVGLSGQTSFPHVHLSVRHDGAVIDPFAPDAQAECAPTAPQSLWQAPPPYRPGGLILAGFAGKIPTYEAVKAGTAGRKTLPAGGAALVVWGYAFGGQADDKIAVTIQGPGGVVIDRSVTLNTGQPLFFRAVGRRTPDGGWPAGRYTGRVSLVRGDTVVETRVTAVTLRP